jgi:uncharacterized protein (TIGR03663 family)
VTTASTRRNRKKKKRHSGGAARARKTAEPAISANATQSEISERTWLIAAISIMVVGAVLRLYDLQLVPLHHDEGVNGNFLVRLVRDGFYHYDPENYHGPTLYYFSAIIPWTIRFLSWIHLLDPSAQNKYGLTTFNIRLVPALFGLATIWLMLLLRRQLGTIGALSAAALLAISPGAVYLSRYFIHESLFVFFTLAIVVAALRFYEDGHPVYLILASASAALLFASKETFIITAPVLVIAVVSTCVYQWLRESPAAHRKNSLTNRLRDTVNRLGGPANLAMWSLVALVVFVAVSVLFYSSFFTNWPKGVYDSLRAFLVWTRTGQEAHKHDSWTYIKVWLMNQEATLALLGIIGAAIVVWKPAKPFALFSALWAFGIIAAYSKVPYKTPWLMLNFIVPLALIGGYALEALYRDVRRDWRLPVAAVMLALCLAAGYQWESSGGSTAPKHRVQAALIPGYQAIDLNFFNYDNDDTYYVYVYAHTKRETLKLLDEIDQIARRTGLGAKMGITIVSPDYWPLPWYLRDYPGTGYHGHMTTTTEPIIIASETQAAEVEATFGGRYQQINSGFNSAGSFALRPGVDLLLYVRRDVPGH